MRSQLDLSFKKVEEKMIDPKFFQTIVAYIKKGLSLLPVSIDKRPDFNCKMSPSLSNCIGNLAQIALLDDIMTEVKLRWITTSEAAKLREVTTRAIRKAAHKGQIEYKIEKTSGGREKMFVKISGDELEAKALNLSDSGSVDAKKSKI